MNGDEAKAALENADCLYSVEQVEQGLDGLAQDMEKHLADADPIILCVMNGGLIPTAALLQRWRFPLQFDYIHATRYRGATEGGSLHWLAQPHSNLTNRTVVVVDDILDEGVTLASIMDACREFGAKEVYSAVLVEKQRTRQVDVEAHFSALTVEDRYVFGYGMDYSGYLRNAPGIFAVKDT